MLSFLLDEHLSPAVGTIVQQSRPAIGIVPVLHWAGGKGSGHSDEELLPAVFAAGLTLVTYDQRTIPRLLHRVADAGQSHAGVVFVDERTIAPANFAALAGSLIQFWDQYQELDWIDRIALLPKGF